MFYGVATKRNYGSWLLEKVAGDQKKFSGASWLLKNVAGYQNKNPRSQFGYWKKLLATEKKNPSSQLATKNFFSHKPWLIDSKNWDWFLTLVYGSQLAQAIFYSPWVSWRCLKPIPVDLGYLEKNLEIWCAQSIGATLINFGMRATPYG